MHFYLNGNFSFIKTRLKLKHAHGKLKTHCKYLQSDDTSKLTPDNASPTR